MEIISVTVEMDAVVDTSPAEDVVVTITFLTLLVLLFVLLPLLNVFLSDINLCILPQVVVVDRVVVLFIILVVAMIHPVLSGDGKAVVLIVKAAINPPLVLSIMQISTVRLKVILTKVTKNTVTPKVKNSTMTNSRNITTRKDKSKEKNSVKRKLMVRKQKQKKLRMPIGLMNLVSDIRYQGKRNSASWIIAL